MSLYNYKTQVTLLLQILPSIALKKCFAMNGGSAINLFVREIPRLSVDIDLTGMTEEPFTYDEYDAIRTKLIQVINQNLGKKDNDFLISFKEGVPDWNIDAFTDFRKFPAIQWKLQNIQKLKQQNPQKHKIQLEALKRVLVKFRD